MVAIASIASMVAIIAIIAVIDSENFDQKSGAPIAWLALAIDCSPILLL